MNHYFISLKIYFLLHQIKKKKIILIYLKLILLKKKIDIIIHQIVLMINKSLIFLDTCQEIINLFNLNINISNKLSTTFVIKDYVEYKITISIKSKSSLEKENQNSLFNISLDSYDIIWDIL